MNPFQKQLLINGRSLADLPDLDGVCRDYGRLEAPRKVTAEEFEATIKEIRACKKAPDAKENPR